MASPERPPVADRRRRRLLLLILGAVLVVALAVTFLVVRTGGQPAPERPPTEVPGEVSGQEYAVSPDGDDDADGSAERPWRTLQHAFAQLRPGDRLTVGDGRYRENVQVDVRKGRQDAPIRVVAADGARPVVQGLLWISDLSWWDIRGINVTWDDRNDSDQHMVKLTDGVGWRFADAEVWGARSFAAILVDGRPKDFTLSGLYVHDTKESNDTNQDHLIYLNCGDGGGVLERSILAHSRNGRALKVGPPDSDGDEVGNIVVRYVTMVDNTGPSNVQLAYEVSGVTVEHSLMVGSAEGRSNVTAFDLDGKDNVVQDSLAWDSAGVLDDADGLEDGGGNVRLDPDLTGADSSRPYFPQQEKAQAYGRYAGLGD